MKKVYVIYNSASFVYGAPFVSGSDSEAIQAVSTCIPRDEQAFALCSSILYRIGKFNSETGELSRHGKKMVASSADLLASAARFSDSTVESLSDMILHLSALKDFYSEVKQNDTCTQED